MELTFVVMMWMTSLIFTLASFVTKWRKYVIFPLLAGLFWNATALIMTQIHYVGMGSQNVIVYSHELGDWSGEVGIVWLIHGVGIIMFCWAIYNGLLTARTDVEMALRGDWEFERLR
jgi:hypothetical protein